MFRFFRRKEKKDDIDLFREELAERQAKIDAEPLNSPIQDKHYNLMEKWRELKLLARDDESYYTQLIETLKQDCDIHDEFVKDYYEMWKEEVSYPAFKELALAYERTGQIQKAIDISEQAIEKNVNEHTSFDNRIKRLERKL